MQDATKSRAAHSLEAFAVSARAQPPRGRAARRGGRSEFVCPVDPAPLKKSAPFQSTSKMNQRINEMRERKRRQNA